MRVFVNDRWLTELLGVRSDGAAEMAEIKLWLADVELPEGERLEFVGRVLGNLATEVTVRCTIETNGARWREEERRIEGAVKRFLESGEWDADLT